MLDNKAIIETVNKLFNTQYLCKVNREYMAMLRDLPDEIEVDVNPQIQAGTFPVDGVVRTESTENMQGIIEMLYNVPNVTMDQELNPDLLPFGPELTKFSTAQIAEVLSMQGELSLVNPKDAVEIHSNIGIYMRQIEDFKFYDLHYKEPPQEDIEAFEKLYGMLDQLARNYSGKGEGNSDLAKLLSMVSHTVTEAKNVTEETPMLALNGASGHAEIANHFGGLKDPYSFN